MKSVGLIWWVPLRAPNPAIIGPPIKGNDPQLGAPLGRKGGGWLAGSVKVEMMGRLWGVSGKRERRGRTLKIKKIQEAAANVEGTSRCQGEWAAHCVHLGLFCSQLGATVGFRLFHQKQSLSYTNL